jgi:organic radical activating enzyme
LYDLDKLPTITGKHLQTADVVCLTGGEPFMIGPNSLIRLCRNIREQYPNIKKLYIYTSGYALLVWSINDWLQLMYYIDGLNISPKSKREWSALSDLLDTEVWCNLMSNEKKSNRLYIFADQWENYDKYIGDISKLSRWQIIGRKWDKEFKTPENEHFVRLPILF